MTISNQSKLLLLWTLLNVLPQAPASGAFSLREQRVKAPEMGELLTYVLICGSDEFTFVPPFEWRVGAEAERHRLVLTSRDRSASIVVSLSDPNPALRKDTEAEALRKQVLARFAGARITNEFACYTSSHQGRAFDVAWTGAGEVQMLSRLAFFPTSSGSIEFSLSTMAGRFRQAEAVLGALMTSFQQRGSLGAVSVKPTSRL